MARRRRPRGRQGRISLGPNAHVNVEALKGPDPKFKPVDLSSAKTGWRAWIVEKELPKYGLPPKLYSVTHGYYWAPKRKAQAICSYCGDDVPGKDCSCGFYSAKSWRHLMQMGYHTYGDIDETKHFKVIGEVACWGKVIEGTQGWRTQFAYPTYLMIPFEMGAEFVRPLREAYGTKVRLMNFLKNVHEITDEDIANLMAGKPKLKLPEKQSRRGRRVGHKKLRFTGRTVSDQYDSKDGAKKLVDVIWDVTPERTVAIDVAHLEFEAR